MDTFDSQDIEIPFQNAYRGPAGEYSDAYKAIVDQYRNDLASSEALRQEQNQEREIRRYIDSGLRPPSMMRQMAQRPQNSIYKSGDDVVRIDPITGQASLIYRHPAAPLRPPAEPRPLSPGYTTKSYEVPEVIGSPAKDGRRSFLGMDWLMPDTAPTPAVEGHPAYKISERTLNALTPPPLVQPQTATTTAPPAPANRSRFYAGERTSNVDQFGFPTTAGIAAADGTYDGARRPLSSDVPPIIINRGANGLDAPPSTTQADEVIKTLKNGRQAVFNSRTKQFIRYAQ